MRPRKRKWTAVEVVDALRHAYGLVESQLVTDEWSLLTEVPLRAPRVSGTTEGYWSNTRTIDVLLTRNWTSGVGHRRIAVEVKVSRSDYRNETDLKRAPAERAAHQTFYATPAGLIDPVDLPPGWGLVEVYPDDAAYAAGTGRPLGTGAGRCRVRRRAVERVPACDLDYLVAAAMRRASRAEERIRRGEDDAAAVPALRAEVESLAAKLARRDDALARERQRTRDLRSITAAMAGGQECADCGQPVRLDTSAYGRTWKHVDPAVEAACERDRAEANRREREAQFGTSYLRGWAAPVEPRALREQAADLVTE